MFIASSLRKPFCCLFSFSPGLDSEEMCPSLTGYEEELNDGGIIKLSHPAVAVIAASAFPQGLGHSSFLARIPIFG